MGLGSTKKVWVQICEDGGDEDAESSIGTATGIVEQGLVWKISQWSAQACKALGNWLNACAKECVEESGIPVNEHCGICIVGDECTEG